jgi:GNAT superfamily N-acetyltransferase
VPKENDNRRTVASPNATGNAGAGFEAKVGAFYLLALLTSGEPRGLTNAVARSIQFQGAVDDRPFDDVIVSALNTDGLSAILEVQAKRTIDFKAPIPNIAMPFAVCGWQHKSLRLGPADTKWLSQLARTFTHIERSRQTVLHWARKHSDAESLAARLSQLDYDREMALIAERGGVALGVAHFFADPDRLRAEYAIAVRSDWKGRGVGFLLMSRLIAIAEQWRIGELVGEVLRENEPMLRMCGELGFAISPDPIILPLSELRRRCQCPGEMSSDQVMKSREVMTSAVVAVSPDTPIGDIAKIQRDHGISAVPGN